MLSLMMQSEHHAICVALFLLAILPMLLGLFGFYELVKAVL